MSLHGLPNIGLSCYMNSVLQALYYIEEFRQFILQTEFEETLSLNHLKSIFEDLSKETYSGPAILNSGCSLEIFKSLCGNFSDCQQDDANHFLMYLLNKFHREVQVYFDSKSDELNQQMENREFIANLFRGRFKYRILCFHCEDTEKRTSEQFFYTFPLNPVKDKVCNINKWMKEFFLPSYINDMLCDDCGTQDMYKHMVVKRWPPYLIINILRIFSTSDGNVGKDNSKVILENDKLHITCDSNAFDANEETKAYSANVEYDLISVINHYGTARFGHYTCTARTNFGWVVFDDSRYEPVEKIDTNHSTLMFFKKVELSSIKSDPE